jgi:protease-4
MSTAAEMLADRRRLRRKLSFWRVCAILALIAVVLAGGLAAAGRSPFASVERQIARISVDGFIRSDQHRMADLFKRVAESSVVSGVVVSIDSPGGTTTGAEELFRGLRELSGKKPMVVFVEGTAASGGYIAALAGDHIVARETSLVGSIGVLFQYPDLSKLMTSLGVQVEEIKSAPLKAEPSPFHPTSPEARAALQQIVADTFDWFKNLDAERRRMNGAEIGAVSSGRVFSGRQGVGLKLVDELGGEREAVAWLEREKRVAKDLPVRDWKPRGRSEFDLWTGATAMAELLGLEEIGRRLRGAADAARATSLDGLLAVWHPSLEK